MQINLEFNSTHVRMSYVPILQTYTFSVLYAMQKIKALAFIVYKE